MTPLRVFGAFQERTRDGGWNTMLEQPNPRRPHIDSESIEFINRTENRKIHNKAISNLLDNSGPSSEIVEGPGMGLRALCAVPSQCALITATSSCLGYYYYYVNNLVRLCARG